MIASIAFLIPNLVPGGAERVVATLAEALARDFRTHIFLVPGGLRHYQPAGVTLHEIDYTEAGIMAACTRLGIDLVFDHYHWDAAHVRLMAGLAGQGLPVVLTEHNAFHYPLFQWVRQGQRDREAWFVERYDHYRRFAAVTVLTEDARRRFARHLDNLCHIPNPLPYEVAAPGASAGVQAVPGREVLNVSSFFKPAKRLDLLYQAFARLHRADPEARLCIVGEADWLADHWLQAASGLPPGAVRLAGCSSRVADHYARAAVLALTSEIEGQPMVLLEAAHHGLPQVAFDLPGLADQVIEGETGHLVPFGDVEAFAARLGEVLADPARARRMGLAARETVRQRFDPGAVLARWHGLIATIGREGRLTSTLEPAPEEASDRFWQDHWARAARPAEAPALPKVSFLVPLYDTEDLLGRCLDSIRRQTLRDFECIVVDDGSPGDAEAAFCAAAKEDGRFRLIRHDANRGLYQARSTAAAAARGLYLAHVDSDDYIHPRFAEILFNEALMTGAEIVECRAVELQPDGEALSFNPRLRPGLAEGEEAARAFFSHSLRNVVWNKLYSRDLWRRTPHHQEITRSLTICEDLLRNALIFAECRRYAAVEDGLYFYCRRAVSVVRGGDLDRLVEKLGDVVFSYDTAMAYMQGPDRALRLRQLAARRQTDIDWYVGEYLDRTAPETVAAGLAVRRAAGDDAGHLARVAHALAARGAQESR